MGRRGNSVKVGGLLKLSILVPLIGCTTSSDTVCSKWELWKKESDPLYTVRESVKFESRSNIK